MRIQAGERALTAFGYLPVLAVLLFLARVRRQSVFAQFHIRQSMVLFLLAFLGTVLFVGFMLAFEPLSVLFIVLLYITWVLYIVLMLVGMWKAGRGERYRMPVVADVALKIGL